MAELPFHEDEECRITALPAPDGSITLRTRYKGTQDALDKNARIRADTPKGFSEKNGLGGHIYHVGSIPTEVYSEMTKRLGRHPTAQECLDLIKSRDFSNLRTREKF